MNLKIINNILFVILFIGIIVFGYFMFLPKEKISSEPVEDEKSTVTNPIPQNTPANEDLTGFESYKFKYTYTINVQGALKSITFKMDMPQTEQGKQYITITSLSEKPQRYYNTPNGQIAEYIFNDISSKKVINVEGIAKVRTYDLDVAEKYSINNTPDINLSAYLKPEKYIESDDSYIIGIANKIQGQTQEEIIQNIYEYLQKNIKYTNVQGNIGAKQALKQRKGKCSEYSAAMVAICRAKNIPARVVVGDILREQFTAHSWVEIYFDKYGWVAFDPTHQGIHFRKYINGKPQDSIIYNSKNTGLNYIALHRNQIESTPINYVFNSNGQGYAYLVKSLTVEKISE